MKAAQAKKPTRTNEVQPTPPSLIVTPGVLLTPPQLAEKLAVPTTWVREKCRERARVRDEDPLPIVRLGKYVRFDWTQVLAWLQRQSQ